MQNLKRFTIFFIILYSLFILINVVECIWNGFGLFDPLKRIWAYPFMKQELRVHEWLNLIDVVALIVFPFACNYLVKKYKLGKGYHFLIVLLSFVPVIYYFLHFVIWRKLNRSIFHYSGRDFMKSDRRIVLIWALILLSLFVSILQTILLFYVESPEIVSLAQYSKRFEPLLKSFGLILFSIVYLSYFLEFKKAIEHFDPNALQIRENQLLDN